MWFDESLQVAVAESVRNKKFLYDSKLSYHKEQIEDGWEGVSKEVGIAGEFVKYSPVKLYQK